MGKIYYIFGKSSSGKDTIYRRLLDQYPDRFKSVVLYTTRPKREGEEDGVTYNYITEEKYTELREQGLIIEERSYNTVHGIWRYMTVKDDQISLEDNDYLILGVLDSFISIRDYFGSDRVIPVYIEVEDGERLTRALEREKMPGNRKYAEMCRRFLTDSEDFSEDKLRAAGVNRRFINDDLEKCLNEISIYITGEAR